MLYKWHIQMKVENKSGTMCGGQERAKALSLIRWQNLVNSLTKNEYDERYVEWK